MNVMLGHNQPENEAQAIREDLEERHRDILKRASDLLDASTRAPDVVDGDNAGAVGDFIKQITECRKALEGSRVASKEPYLAGGRTVDGFFKAVTTKLDGAKKMIQGRLTKHLREVEAAERKRREEEARQAREEAERAAKEAAEREAAMQEDTDLDAALDAEKAAEQAKADAAKRAQEAEAKAAELSRVRGDFGSVGSLKTQWVFEVTDRDKLDLETLRPFIPADALDKAGRAFVRSGGRKLAGAAIYQDTVAAVR